MPEAPNSSKRQVTEKGAQTKSRKFADWKSAMTVKDVGDNFKHGQSPKYHCCLCRWLSFIMLL